MSVFLADSHGLHFCTGKPKAVYAQLKACPDVELCFFSAEDMTQLRVRGIVEESDDVVLKKQAIEAFPFLKPIDEGRR